MTNYFYIDTDGQQQGPVSPLSFTALGITTNTFVWCNGMADWKRAGELPELQMYLDKSNEVSEKPSSPIGGGVPPRFNREDEKPNPYAHHEETTQQQTGYAGQPYGGQVCPNTHLAASIICTVVWGLICFSLPGLIAGIVAIVKSCNVETRFHDGDYAGAVRQSKSAYNWIIGSIIAGIGGWVLLIIGFIFMGLTLGAMGSLLSDGDFVDNFIDIMQSAALVAI